MRGGPPYALCLKSFSHQNFFNGFPTETFADSYGTTPPGGSRTATNAANAILNYLYCLLEIETTIACHRVGLDPGLGIFHTDQRDRASLATDAMEAVRPAVDAYVLALLSRRTLTIKHFGETPSGACRLTSAMTARLAETVPTWAAHVAPHVERIAHRLQPSDTTAPLTHAHHLASWQERRPNRKRRGSTRALVLPTTCRECGDDLPNRRNRFCERCRQNKWREQAVQGRANAARVFETLRSEQRDPRHGGQAAKLRGEKNRAHQYAVKAWTGETPDPGVFVAEILPGLRDASIGELVAATGLSEHYVSLIRLGKRVPHARHWEALRAVGKPLQTHW